MGTSNAAVLVPTSILIKEPPPLSLNTLVSPTADMLASLDTAGIQAVPIIG